MVPKRLARLEEHRLPGGLRLYVGRSQRERFLGLMGLAELPADCALLVPGCDSVHTFWMRFPIDVLFIDARGRVVHAVPRVRPRRVVSHRGAAAAIETAAGQGERIERLHGEALLSIG